MTHRTMHVWLTSALAVLFVMAGGSAAWAFWTASGTKTGTVSADAFPTAAGAKPTVSVAGGTATVKFTAVTTNGGRPAGGYTITRYDGTGAAVQTSTTCNTAVTPVSCSMSSVPLGAWTYSYKPLLGTNWGGTTSLKSDSAGATKLAFTTAARSGTASATANLGPITVEIEDAAGQAITVPSDLTVSLSSNSAGTATFGASSGGSALTSVTISANSSSASFFYGDTKAASPTITASATSVTSTTQIETINAGTATRFVVAAGSSQTAGTAFAVNLNAQDSFGNPATSYTGSHTITLTTDANPSPSGATPTLPSGAVTFSSGAATINGVVLVKAETGRTITASDGSSSGTSGSISIGAGAATSLAWTGNPTASVGSVGSPCFFTCTVTGIGRSHTFTATISVTDNWGNTVSNVGSGHSVTVTANAGASTSPSSASLPATGLATTSAFTITTSSNNSWTTSNVTGSAAGYASVTATLNK